MQNSLKLLEAEKFLLIKMENNLPGKRTRGVCHRDPTFPFFRSGQFIQYGSKESAFHDPECAALTT